MFIHQSKFIMTWVLWSFTEYCKNTRIFSGFFCCCFPTPPTPPPGSLKNSELSMPHCSNVYKSLLYIYHNCRFWTKDEKSPYIFGYVGVSYRKTVVSNLIFVMPFFLRSVLPFILYFSWLKIKRFFTFWSFLLHLYGILIQIKM